MSQLLIRQAIQSAIDGLGLGVPIAGENMNFDPTETTDEIYIELNFIPADTESLGKNTGASDEIVGICQANVHMKSGIGTNDGLSLIDQIFTAFPYGTELVAGGQVVRINNKTTERLFNGDGWAVIPATLEYSAYSART